MTFYIDFNIYQSSVHLRHDNLRNKVKSVKEIIYKEQHSKHPTELQIETERFSKYSIFGDDITNCEINYDSYGKKTKLYSNTTKILTEYKHTYSKTDNCIETKQFENGNLISTHEYIYHNKLLLQESIFTNEGAKRICQSQTKNKYLNSLLIAKKHFKRYENNLLLYSSYNYWYDENNKIIRQIEWHKENETDKSYFYNNSGQLIQICGVGQIDINYSSSGRLTNLKQRNNVIEYDDKGNCVSNYSDNDTFSFTNKYEYDPYHNWTKKIKSSVSLLPQEVEQNMSPIDIVNINAPRIIVTERKIEYY